MPISHNLLDLLGKQSNDPAVTIAPYLDSSVLEKLLEHRFITGLGTILWQHGIRDFEILRGEVDVHGHDLVVEAGGVLRHIQLKMTRAGGKRSRITVNRRLAAKPSGCIPWGCYDPDTLMLGEFRWFGGSPGEPLPDLGEKIAHHSKGNASGKKTERPGHRELNAGAFAKLESIYVLVDRLFGPLGPAQAHHEEFAKLKAQFATRGKQQAAGASHTKNDAFLAAVPAGLVWSGSAEIADMIDGDALAADLGFNNAASLADISLNTARANGCWPGSIARLWCALFLEHRRWRMAGCDPDPETHQFLDMLCGQLSRACQRRSCQSKCTAGKLIAAG